MKWKSPQLTTYEIDIVIGALEYRGSAYDLRLAVKLMRANGLYATADSTEAQLDALERGQNRP